MPNYKERNRTDLILLHCSATKPNQDIDLAEIRRWHIKRGWIDVGYHFIIRLNGDLEIGRPHNVVGSHCRGVNWKSIGICLVGGLDSEGNPANTYNEAQLKTLRALIEYLRNMYPDAIVKGHYELDERKECPCATVEELLNDTTRESTGLSPDEQDD